MIHSTVTAVESFRFLGTTIAQDLKWDNHIESIVKKAQQRLFFLHQLRNLPQELLKQFYSAIIESVLCTSINVWFSSATKSDLRRLQRVVWTGERIIDTTLSKNCTHPEWAKGLEKSLWTSHQHTPSLNCYRLVDASELWAPERPDTETVSSLKQYISWTLDIKRGTHNTIIHYIINTHTYFFSFHVRPVHIIKHNLILYYLLCFDFLYISYLYIIVLLSDLSCCCHSVALWSFCRYNRFLVCVNTWPIKLILILSARGRKRQYAAGAWLRRNRKIIVFECYTWLLTKWRRLFKE